MTTRQRAASTADEYEKQQRAEWSTYVAKVAVDFHGTRAYNVGDPVPASAVDGPDAWVPADFVDKRATPFEGSATVPPPEPPEVDPTVVAAPPAASPDAVTSTEG